MRRSSTRNIQPVRQRRQAIRSHTLTELLNRRPELVGVNALADVVAESVCWGV